MKTVRQQRWEVLLKKECPYFWPPFLINLALDYEFGEDPFSLFKNEAFCEEAAQMCEDKHEIRVPRGFGFTTEELEQLCQPSNRSGMDHYVSCGVKIVLKGLVGGHLMPNSNSGNEDRFSADQMEDFRDVLRSVVLEYIAQYDPEGGKKDSESGFEAFLWMFAINRARRLIGKLVYARSLISLDQPVGEGESTITNRLEAAGHSALVTKPALAQLGRCSPERIQEVFYSAELKTLSGHPCAALYVLVIGGIQNAEDACKRLAIPLATGYRWLSKACEEVLDCVRESLAREAGLSVDDARAEILGRLLGSTNTERQMDFWESELAALGGLAVD